MNKDRLFVLKHKNIDVAEILFGGNGHIAAIPKICNKAHLPAGTVSEEGKIKKDAIEQWWEHRGIPKDREGFKNILTRYNIKDKTELLIRSFGLSLTDHYWVAPESMDAAWEKYNFYENDFSRDMGYLFFGKAKNLVELNPLTPDVSSDGKLTKRWDIKNGKRVLVKGGSGIFFQEPFNEVFVSELCKKTGVNHVPYTCIKEDGLYYSVCENMTDTNAELIYASRVYDLSHKNSNDSNYLHYIKCCEKVNLKAIIDDLNKMIVLDFIIANTDRHWNNFGLLRDSTTLHYKSSAPLYDSGTSLWNNTNFILYDRQNIVKSKCFADTNYQQLKLVTDFSWYHSKNLKGTEELLGDILSQNEYMKNQKDRIKKLKHCFKNNLEVLDRMIEERYEIKKNNHQKGNERDFY
jgi:hypothetical protein